MFRGSSLPGSQGRKQTPRVDATNYFTFWRRVKLQKNYKTRRQSGVFQTAPHAEHTGPQRERASADASSSYRPLGGRQTGGAAAATRHSTAHSWPNTCPPPLLAHVKVQAVNGRGLHTLLRTWAPLRVRAETAATRPVRACVQLLRERTTVSFRPLNREALRFVNITVVHWLNWSFPTPHHTHAVNYNNFKK